MFSQSLAIGAEANDAFIGDVNTLEQLRGIYVDGRLGYAWTYIQNRLGTPPNNSWSHGNGFIAGGVDVGLQYNATFALESGVYFLPTAKLNNTLLGSSVSFSTIAYYVAGRASLALYQNTRLFAKVGAAYTHTSITGVSAQTHWGPLFAVGTQYHFDKRWLMEFQFTRLAGATRNTLITPIGTTQSAVPDSNILTLGVGFLIP